MDIEYIILYLLIFIITVITIYFKYDEKEISVPPNTLVLVKPNTVIHGISPILDF